MAVPHWLVRRIRVTNKFDRNLEDAKVRAREQDRHRKKCSILTCFEKTSNGKPWCILHLYKCPRVQTILDTETKRSTECDQLKRARRGGSQHLFRLEDSYLVQEVLASLTIESYTVMQLSSFLSLERAEVYYLIRRMAEYNLIRLEELKGRAYPRVFAYNDSS